MRYYPCRMNTLNMFHILYFRITQELDQCDFIHTTLKDEVERLTRDIMEEVRREEVVRILGKRMEEMRKRNKNNEKN